MKKLLVFLLSMPALALAQSYPSPTFNSLTLQTPLTVANGGTGATSSTGTGSLVLGTSPTLASPTITGSLTATGLVSNADLATQSANTLLGNGTSSTASPSALAVPSCSATGSALGWTSGTGFNCFTGYAPLASPTFTGTVTLPATSQIATGSFFGPSAQMNNLNDRIFIGALTPFNGTITNSIPDWTGSYGVVGGVPAFSYLEENGTVDISSIKGELGLVSALRTSDGAGGGTQVSLGISSVVLNDNSTGGGASSANFYGTSVRTAAATGYTMGNMELDNTNMGANVPIYPYTYVTNGTTNVLNLAAGGELANQTGSSYTINNTSAAMTISSNAISAYPNAVFDKGIVFAYNALNSNNTAIAFYTGHQMQWFNSSNVVTGRIYSSATTTATGQDLVLSPFGFLVTDLSNYTQFQVNNTVTSAANYIFVSAATTGNSPLVQAQGSDTNVNLLLEGKGNGGVNIAGQTSGTAVGAGYVGQLLTAQSTNISVTTGVAVNAASLSLGPGIWDVEGCVTTIPAATTTTQNVFAAVSTVSATLPGFPNQSITGSAVANQNLAICSPITRENLSATTTVYAVGSVNFATSTMSVSGYIRAVRVN